MASSERSVVRAHHPALEILDGNRRAWGVSYDTPDRKHYPHAFLWDLGFAAIVRADLDDPEGARDNILAILAKQKLNGLLPNMGFGPGRDKDLERKTFLNPRNSSDYSQPPVIAHAALNTYKAFVREGREGMGRAFLLDIYPSLYAYYDYLGTKRVDPGSDLVAVIHPHETGRDSDPTYDGYKFRLTQPEQGKFLVRGATDIVNSGFDYASALKLNMKHKARNWDVTKAREVFWEKDVMFNAIYAQNLDYLGQIAKEIGIEEDAFIFGKKSQKITEDIETQMWSDKTKSFHAVNAQGRKHSFISISNLFPIILESIPRKQVEAIVDMIEDPKMFNTPYPLPSVPLNVREYDGSYTEKRLWRGPVWMNTSWYLVNGLIAQRDNYKDHAPEFAERLNKNALHIARKSAELIEKSGCREFYDPLTGEGKRVKNFAWSTLGYLIMNLIPNLERYARTSRIPI